MKLKYIFITIALITAFTFKAYSQKNITVAPKLISFKHSKFSMGISLEGGFVLPGAVPTDLNLSNKDPRIKQTNIPYASYGLVFDLYSANSIIGILGGVDFAHSKFGLENQNAITDYYDITRIEIPLNLKFRFGASNGKKHLWLLLGGAYNLPQTCKREQFDAALGDQAYTILSDENKNQLSNYFAATGSIGYEFFLGSHKHFRGALYSRIVYPLSNELNSNYSEYKPTGNSVLSNTPNFDIRGYRVTVGLKLMFQFGEAVAIMADAIKTSK